VVALVPVRSCKDVDDNEDRDGIDSLGWFIDFRVGIDLALDSKVYPTMTVFALVKVPNRCTWPMAWSASATV
jgi:hypothetical protein